MTRLPVVLLIALSLSPLVLALPQPECYSGAYADPEACCAEIAAAGLTDPSCDTHPIVGDTCASRGPRDSWAFKQCCRDQPWDDSCPRQPPVGRTCASRGPRTSRAFKACCRDSWDRTCIEPKPKGCAQYRCYSRQWNACCWRKYRNGTIRKDAGCKRFRRH